MPFLYRTAVIVSRKQPYIDWANSLREGDDDGFPEELAPKRDVYLGPMSELEQTLNQALDAVWQDIFEEELYGWSTDESQWPVHRTREMFHAWFEVELAESIVDLAPEDPLTEDDMELADAQDAMEHCAWCGAALGDGQGRMVTFGLSARDWVEGREGRVLSLIVRKDRIATGIVTPKESRPAQEGADVVFRACSRPCEKRLLKEVPAALRDLETRLTARRQPG